MGRGKSWSREESEAVAKAWKQASELYPSREQNSKHFAKELYQRFLGLAPGDPASLDGRWSSRSPTAVKTQFDTIGDDVLKFNAVISNVMEQATNGGIDTSDERVLRAAVAVHLGVVEGLVNFDDINSVESDWKLFGAWKVLKTCPRFAPINWPGVRTGTPDDDTENDEHVVDNPANPRSGAMDTHNGPFMNGENIPATGGTPMRTLASAALSMPLVSSGIPPMQSLGGATTHGGSPEANGHADPHHPHPGVSANGVRPHHPFQRLGKRRQEDLFDAHQPQKEPRLQPLDDFIPGSNALEIIGNALRALGDALSEYNALSLFSRPDMEGRQEQKIFLDALAEKHLLKARLERDKLKHDVQQ